MTPARPRDPCPDVVRVLQVTAADAPPPDGVFRAIGGRPGVLQEVVTVPRRGGPRAVLRIARLSPGRDVVHAHGGKARRWCRTGLALSGSSARLLSMRLSAAAGAAAAGDAGAGDAATSASDAVASYRAAVRSRRLRTAYRARLERRGRVRRALPIRSA